MAKYINKEKVITIIQDSLFNAKTEIVQDVLKDILDKISQLPRREIELGLYHKSDYDN